MKTKPVLSNEAKALYNTLLTLNWDNPQITLDHVITATKLRRSALSPLVVELIGATKVLLGNEEGTTGLIETLTPIVKGGAYGFPYDDFKLEEWTSFEYEIN